MVHELGGNIPHGVERLVRSTVEVALLERTTVAQRGEVVWVRRSRVWIGRQAMHSGGECRGQRRHRAKKRRLTGPEGGEDAARVCGTG